MSVNNIIFAPTTTHHDAIMALTSSSVLNISVKVTSDYEVLLLIMPCSKVATKIVQVSGLRREKLCVLFHMIQIFFRGSLVVPKREMMIKRKLLL